MPLPSAEDLQFVPQGASPVNYAIVPLKSSFVRICQSNAYWRDYSEQCLPLSRHLFVTILMRIQNNIRCIQGKLVDLFFFWMTATFWQRSLVLYWQPIAFLYLCMGSWPLSGSTIKKVLHKLNYYTSKHLFCCLILLLFKKNDNTERAYLREWGKKHSLRQKCPQFEFSSGAFSRSSRLVLAGPRLICGTLDLTPLIVMFCIIHAHSGQMMRLAV